MIRSMLGDSYLADVEKVAGDGSRSSTKSSGRADDLLFEVLIKGTDIIEAQKLRPGRVQRRDIVIPPSGGRLRRAARSVHEGDG